MARSAPGIYADVNPRWSHDGQHVGFIRITPDRRQQLFVIDADLGRPLPLLEPELVCPDRPYSPGLKRYCSPDTIAWSPEDKEIAFERIEWFNFEDGQRLPGTGIWSLNIRSGTVTQLVLHPNLYRSALYYYHTPQWSPDGRYISFVAEGINGQRTIGVRPLAAQTAKEVLPLFDKYEQSDWPSWNPHLSIGASAHSIASTDGNEAGRSALVFRRGILTSPSVPMTETLRCVLPGSASTKRSGEIWRIRPADYARLLSTHDTGRIIVPRSGHLSWSPDGKHIAFSLTPDAMDFERYQLWVMQADGSGALCVSPPDGRGYFAPVWLGNHKLGALSPNASKYEVVILDISAKSAQRLGTIESADCDWSPDRRSIAR